MPRPPVAAFGLALLRWSKSGVVGCLMVVALLFSEASTATAGPVLYGATYPGNGSIGRLITIDPDSGGVRTIGSLGFRLRGLAYDPHQDILFALGGPRPTSADPPGTIAEELPVTLFRIDRAIGTASPVGALGAGVFGDFWGLAYDSNLRKLYAISETGLYGVDLATGAGSLIGLFPDAEAVGAVRDLTFDPLSDKLFLSTEGVSKGVDVNGLSLVDQRTGAVTFLGAYDPTQAFGGFNNVRGIEFDTALNRLLGINDGRQSFRESLIINPLTGEATILAMLPSNLDGLGGLAFAPAVSPQAIPEPSTLLMVLASVSLLGLGWRRRKRAGFALGLTLCLVAATRWRR